MKSLTWNQVNAWRLAQHGLAPRLKRQAFVEVTSRLFGIHAQVMSAAELALGARTDLWGSKTISEGVFLVTRYGDSRGEDPWHRRPDVALASVVVDS